jgi:hypothetical protein
VATTREWSERYYWSEPRLVVELFSPLEGQQSLEFRALPRKQGELGSKVYDDKIESANAFKAVAEALSARLG